MLMQWVAAAAVAWAGSDAAGVEIVRGDKMSGARHAIADAAMPLEPRAIELVDSDPAIRQWAVRLFDRNGDGWLTVHEAQPVLGAFEDIADEDRDGRVTVREYRAAVDFLRSRY